MEYGHTLSIRQVIRAAPWGEPAEEWTETVIKTSQEGGRPAIVGEGLVPRVNVGEGRAPSQAGASPAPTFTS